MRQWHTLNGNEGRCGLLYSCHDSRRGIFYLTVPTLSTLLQSSRVFLILVASCSAPPVAHGAKSHPKKQFAVTLGGASRSISHLEPQRGSIRERWNQHAGSSYRRGVKPRINPATYGRWRVVFQVRWICDDCVGI